MAIAYSISTNIITVTAYTEAVPANFTDIYNADKAGTLSLHARTGIVGTDGAGVAVDRAERPTDYVVLGGASNDLYIIVANWNGTTATIRITGTDRDGAAQTEDIVVNANGTYYTTKWFKTITHTQVTAFTATSFDYDLTQGQWGVVWRECTKQFCFDCGLIIGDGSTATWFADSGKQAMHKVFNVPAYSSGYYGAMNVKANANCRFGAVMDATNKLGMYGCHFFYDSTGSYFGVMVEGSGNLSCYSCIFDGDIMYGCGAASTPALTGTFKAWNCMFNTTLYVSKGTIDINKCAINKKQLGNSYGIAMATPQSIENVEVYGTRSRGAFSAAGTSGVSTVKNAYIRDCTNLYVLWGQSATHNVINADTDTWVIYRRGSGSEIVQKQFTFDLKVIDKDNGAINGATVKIWDKDSNLIVDTTTNASGVIATETITASICPAGSSTFSTLKTPHLIKIEKADYTTYEADFTLEEKTDWLIALQVGGGLMRNPPMTGGMV